MMPTDGSDASKKKHGNPSKTLQQGHFSIESAVKLVNKC